MAIVYWASITQENDSFCVSFPDKPNVNTFGDTLEDALAQAKDALNVTIEIEIDTGFAPVVPKHYGNQEAIDKALAYDDDFNCEDSVLPGLKELFDPALHPVAVRPDLIVRLSKML
jgi:predicted RNase H-like HicB family nuclease